MNAKTTIRFAAAALIGLTSVSAYAFPAPSTASLAGSVTTAQQVDRTVDLANARQVNVNWGETVRFVDQGRSFVVRFDGVKSAVDLRQLAPAGILDHAVTAYVASDASISPFSL